jgi:hypothetical protein
MPSSSKRQCHPSVGVHDTLKRYFASKMAKLSTKRRKLDSLTQPQALQQYLYLTSATRTNCSYSIPRSHILTLKTPTSTQEEMRSKSKDIEIQKVSMVSESKTTFNRLTTIESSIDEKSPKDDRMHENQDNNNKKSLFSDEIITTNSKTVADLTQYDHLYYQQQADNIEVATVQIEAAKQHVQKDQVALWGVYTYGLQYVMGLTDLASSPDAILPGNFSSTTATECSS